MPEPRRILVVEDKWDGHYLYYVRLLVLAAEARGERVVLLTRAGLVDTPVGRFYLADLADRMEVRTTATPTVDEAERVAASVGAVRTVVPDADLWLAPLARRGGWRGPGELSLLVLRSSTQPRRVPGQQVLRTGIKRALMARVAVMPHVQLSLLRSSIWRGRSPVAATPDPITSATTPERTAQLAAAWGLDADRTWFGVLGNITDRKNLPMVAAALARVAADVPVGLLVAGQIEDGELARAQPDLGRIAADGRLVLIERMLDEDELDSAVAALDCLVLAHSNEGPSGLLAKAAATGTRVLTAGARSLRADARRIPTVSAWVPLDPAALEAALRRVPGLPRPRPAVEPGTRAFTDSLLGPPPTDGRRVVWCSPSYGYGGELMYFESIFAGLAGRFPAMTIPVARDFPVARYPGLPLRPILRLHRVRGQLIPSLGTLVRLARLRPQVLIGIEFTPLAVLGMLLARALPGARRVLLLLESDPAYRGTPGSPSVLAVKHALARLADVVVANSPLAERYAVDRLRIPAEKVVQTAYLTSEPGLHRPAGAPPPQRTDGRRSVLFVNSLVERKGPHLLIEAFAAMPASARAAARLDVVGDGGSRRALESLARDLGVEHDVVFHGRLPYRELWPHYATADVVVAPSLSDYRSLGAIEAASAGVPAVVSSRDGAHAELALSGAFVVDPQDRAALTAALVALLTDDGVRADRAALAQAGAAQHSVDRVVAGLADVIAGAATR